jgi:hypothetical protein
MKQSVNKWTFHDAFKGIQYERNFSYQGLNVLFDYLESYEQDTDTEIELDVTSLCCDYTEAEIATVLADYGYSDIDELRDNTTVIEVDDETVIYGAH